MEIIGIICEYNPFHLGHLYQINQIKKMYPDSLIICILNGTFMQRGELSIINKWDKTKICLENQIDIVVELPFVFATQSADIFAQGATYILNELKINKLVFGSETNDVNLLTKLANTQLNNKNFDELVKKYLDKGINYPTALSKALEKLTKTKIDKPNDLLAISYIKEIIKNNYPITPISIKRTNNYHNKDINNEKNQIINASLIRKMIDEKKDISLYVPEITLKYLNNIPSKEKYYNLLKYQIINNIDNLNQFQTVDEGLDNLIKKNILATKNVEELIKSIKTKRYTYNKISRMLTHILTNLKKEEVKNLKIDYIRLLGFNKKGQSYLNKIKKEITIPLITKYSKNNFKLLNIEKRIAHIYSLLLNDKTTYLQDEYSNKPIIK